MRRPDTREQPTRERAGERCAREPGSSTGHHGTLEAKKYRREILKSAALAASVGGFSGLGSGEDVTAQVDESASQIAGTRPNIVVVYVDDMGWFDTSFQGSEFYETEHVDQLAEEGLAFSDAHANGPNCAPSRASLMTGQYTPRHGIFTVNNADRGSDAARRVEVPTNETVLPSEATTVAEVISDAGYTTAFMGKWHLGAAGTDAGPTGQGFDINVGGTSVGHPPNGYFPPYNLPNIQGSDGEYLTNRMTDRAVEFIQQTETNDDGPFYLQLSNYAVHTPIQAPSDLSAPFEDKPPSNGQHNATYAGMVEAVDQCVKRVRQTLEDLGVLEETLIVFTCDNGGLGDYEEVGLSPEYKNVTSQGPLRGGKGTLYEGGIREPMVFYWPGTIEPGETSAPVVHTDLFPTFAELVGGDVPDDHTLDGVSLLPLVEGSGSLPDRPLFWHFPAYLQAGNNEFRTRPCSVIRQGKWKLIHYFEYGKLELYDLEADIGEENDLATERPDVRETLRKRLEQWWDETDAPLPTTHNPEFDPSTRGSHPPETDLSIGTSDGPGSTQQVTVTLSNESNTPLKDVDFDVDVPPDWTVTASGSPPSTVDAGSSGTGTREVEPSGSGSGGQLFDVSELDATATYHWAPFTATVPDATSFSNDGELVGSESLVSGQNGSALEFDGSTWIEAPGNQSLDITAPPMTIEFWVKPGEPQNPDEFGSQQPYVSKGGGQYNVKRNPDGDVLFSFHDTDDWNVVSTAPPDDWSGNWHHVAVVMTTDELRLFVDSTLQNTVDLSDRPDTIRHVDTNATIGTHSKKDDTLAAGTAMDDLRIYDRALSQSELASTPDTPPDGAVLWYDFDDLQAPPTASTSASAVRASTSIAASDLGSGLKGLWRFNGTASDGSGNGNDVQLKSGAGYSNDTVEGSNSLSLGSENAYALISPRQAGGFFHEAFQERSLAFWCHPDSLTGSRSLVNFGGLWNGFAVRIEDGSLEFATQNDQNMAVVSTEVAEPTWMHVAAIFDGGTLELYVDGALEASTSDVGYSQIPSHGGGSRIGVATLEDGTGADAFGSDSDADYAGLIDVVAVYDRVLSPAEVGTLAGALDPEPVVGTVSPTDPDGDSDYEDIDGDEQVTSDDLEAYAEHIDDPELTDQIAAFDFNDNDRIDHGDLIELFLESQQ